MAPESPNKRVLAYVVGLALGDGNLSNPNGRAIRLRITCDTRYPNLICRIIKAVKTILPYNCVSLVHRPRNCVDISCYSNLWENWLGWKAGKGTKIHQKVSVPHWIKANDGYSRNCLRGLIETDGSIYRDRGYPMVNFVTMVPSLADDVFEMVVKLGFKVNLYKIAQGSNIKYTVRVSKNTRHFIKTLRLLKN